MFELQREGKGQGSGRGRGREVEGRGRGRGRVVIAEDKEEGGAHRRHEYYTIQFVTHFQRRY